MLKTNSWLYLDLQKTGSLFFKRKLLEIFPESYFDIDKRHGIQLINYDIPKIITIRNPESYYFSLWSYGLKQMGGLYTIIKNFYPEKINLFYKSASKESFSYFLDYVLSLPYKNPQAKFSKKNILNIIFNLRSLKKISNKKNKLQRNYFTDVISQEKWLPDSCDLYTCRIFEMLIPKSERNIFIQNLKADLSPDNLNDIMKEFIPEIILRTESLNRDFYDYYDKNKLNFLDLPEGWQQIFSLKDTPINISTNASKQNKSKKIENYLSEYHRSLIKSKSNLANLLLNKAEERLKS